jgi:hypothetical protein
MLVMLWFDLVYRIEHLHPLEAGLFRLKYRRDRRPGLPIENPLVFYPKIAAELAVKASKYAWSIWQAYRIFRRVTNDPSRASYSDLAITPVEAGELDTLAMFHDTAGGEAAVAKKRRADELRENFAMMTAAE